ncbi:hypothetical protein J2X45_003402 [Caulobacter sp. BE264]|uniref:DUF7697 family protein n=1 Tax=Caulobacter sp. BE264 TaxID=2817724 RepID=UPI00285F0839|nr:hypothetical protein [Caulobacter sp. BE264]MDR7232296.1 hypothetical protein [Caulobacter sp. BE264]
MGAPWGGRDFCAHCPAVCDDCPDRTHACETAEGEAVWNHFVRSERQLRVGMSGPYALDFAAVLLSAQVLGLDLPLIAELLDELEPLIIYAWRPQDDG